MRNAQRAGTPAHSSCSSSCSRQGSAKIRDAGKPRDLERLRRQAPVGSLHAAPSSSISSSASRGPQLPAAYVGIRFGVCASQYWISGSTTRHAASTSSLRVNSVASPIITSSSSVSYAGAVDLAERLGVVEVHVDRRDLDVRRQRHRRAGHLHLEVERHAFVRLHAHHEHVRPHRLRSPAPNIRCGGARNWTAISDTRLRQPLARSQIERHAVPAPVVDVEAHRGVRRRRANPARRPAPRGSRAPPSRRSSRRRTARARRSCGIVSGVSQRIDLSTFTFSSRTAFGRHLRRRLHRGERQQLQQVVLEHVAHDAGFLVVLAALLDADRLRRRDLHVVDPLPVPDRLEDRVGEAQHQHVLHRLLAEVVIDAVDLMLGEQAEHELVERQRALEAAAERLLDDDARPRAIRRSCASAARARSPRDAARSARTRSAAPRDRRAGCTSPGARRFSISASRLPIAVVVVGVREVGRHEVAAACTSSCHSVVVELLRLRPTRPAPRASARGTRRRSASSSRPTPSIANSSSTQMLRRAADRSPAAACARQIAERAEDHHRARVGALARARAARPAEPAPRCADDRRQSTRRGAVMCASPRVRRTRCAAPRSPWRRTSPPAASGAA